MKNLLFLTFLFFVQNIYSQTSADLKINERSYITIPAEGSDVRYCNNELVDLEFKVHNLSTTNTIDLTANSLIVTLTFDGANSGLATAIFNSSHFSSGAVNTIEKNDGYAEFQWPTDLSFINAGTTSITLSAMV